MSSGFTHESTHNESKEWYTPPSVFDALGIDFDLDVSSPGAEAVPWVPAWRHLTFEDNGLMQPWSGRVWCNPPYGKDTPSWISKFASHGNGIALVFARTDTKWFHQNAAKIDLFCFVAGRLQFVPGLGAELCPKGANASAASMLLACGEECAKALRRSGLGFCLDGRKAA